MRWAIKNIKYEFPYVCDDNENAAVALTIILLSTTKNVLISGAYLIDIIKYLCLCWLLRFIFIHGMSVCCFPFPKQNWTELWNLFSPPLTSGFFCAELRSLATRNCSAEWEKCEFKSEIVVTKKCKIIEKQIISEDPSELLLRQTSDHHRTMTWFIGQLVIGEVEAFVTPPSHHWFRCAIVRKVEGKGKGGRGGGNSGIVSISYNDAFKRRCKNVFASFGVVRRRRRQVNFIFTLCDARQSP